MMTLVLAFIAGISCQAQTFTAGGLKYTVTSTVTPLTVSLNGPDVTDKTTYTGPLAVPATVDYNGNTYAVTSIVGYAFQNCASMTNSTDLYLPDGITFIGTCAFDHCSGLTGSLHLPTSLTTLGSFAFRACTGLTGGITIPSGVTAIGDNAFLGCTELNGTLSMPDGLLSIGVCAFQNCSKLNGPLAIPAGVTSIGVQAFDGCSGFTGTLTIPAGLTTINNYAFRNCSGLIGNLVIPDLVTSIGSNAFSGCTGFHGTLTIPSTATTIGAAAFANCSNLKGTLSLPAGLTVISANVFQNCMNLTGTLVLPSGVTSIGTQAFDGCTGFTGQLDIPSGVTSIAGLAFRNCSGLTGSIVIPSGVTILSSYVFQNCTGLDGTLTLPDNVTDIQVDAFYRCIKLTGPLTLPSHLKTIGLQAFRECAFTGPLTIPNGVTTIDYSAFNGCKNFSGKLTIPESVTFIGNSTFSGCEGLTGDLVIPSKVTTIDYNTFSNCKGLNSVTIPNTVTAINAGAFYNCTSMLCKISEGYSGAIAYAFTNTKGVWFSDKNPAFTPSDATNGIGIQTTYYIPEDDNSADAQGTGSIKALYQAKIISTKNTIRYYHLGLKTVERNLATMTSSKYGSTSAGVATLYVNFPAIVPKGLKAYYGKEVPSSGVVRIKSIDNTLSTAAPSISNNVTTTIIPTKCGVVLMGDKVDNDTVFEAATVGTATAFGTAIEPTGTAAEKGILSGSLTNIDKSTVTGGTVYTFGTGTTSGVVGFYPYNGTTLSAHKAFLVKTAEMPSKDSSGLILSIDDSADEPTAISGLSDDSNTKDNAPYYNLQGIRVKTPIQGGIYIHNGKKIVIY
jgi:hypothetical protein